MRKFGVNLKKSVPIPLKQYKKGANFGVDHASPDVYACRFLV